MGHQEGCAAIDRFRSCPSILSLRGIKALFFPAAPTPPDEIYDIREGGRESKRKYISDPEKREGRERELQELHHSRPRSFSFVEFKSYIIVYERAILDFLSTADSIHSCIILMTRTL